MRRYFCLLYFLLIACLCIPLSSNAKIKQAEDAPQQNAYPRGNPGRASRAASTCVVLSGECDDIGTNGQSDQEKDDACAAAGRASSGAAGRASSDGVSGHGSKRKVMVTPGEGSSATMPLHNMLLDKCRKRKAASGVMQVQCSTRRLRQKTKPGLDLE